MAPAFMRRTVETKGTKKLTGGTIFVFGVYFYNCQRQTPPRLTARAPDWDSGDVNSVPDFATGLPSHLTSVP